MVLLLLLCVSRPQGIASDAALEDLGLCLGGPGVEGGEAAWIEGVLAAPASGHSIPVGIKHGGIKELISWDPGDARYAGMLGATVTGGMWLLWVFLASGSSAPGRIEHKGGRDSWIIVTLGVPSVQGHKLPQTQELWTYLSLFLPSVKATQLCTILCDPMDYTVHGILQARVPEWVAFPFSRGSSPPRNRTQVFRIADGFFTS